MNRTGEYKGNRILTQEELSELSAPLFEEVKRLLNEYSRGDTDLLWALRRKLGKQLTVEEKGRQIDIRKLKEYKRGQQVGNCNVCSDPLPERGAILDRFSGMKPYVADNTQLICPDCDAQKQRDNGWR